MLIFKALYLLYNPKSAMHTVKRTVLQKKIKISLISFINIKGLFYLLFKCSFFILLRCVLIE